MLHKLLHIIIVPFFRYYNHELMFFEHPGAVYLAVPVAVHIWEHLEMLPSQNSSEPADLNTVAGTLLLSPHYLRL